MTNLFTPLGGKSRRKMVIEHFAAVGYDTTVPYEVLEGLLGADRQTVQGTVNQAKTGLQKELCKSIVAVRNVGYRVLRPGEHVNLARTHQRKGRRSTKRARSTVDNTDIALLSDVERAKLEIASAMLAAFQVYERRADLRYASRERVEQHFSEQAAVNRETAKEVSSVQERLERLERVVMDRRAVAS